MSDEQRRFMFRSIAAESEQLLGVVKRAALSHTRSSIIHCAWPSTQRHKLRIVGVHICTTQYTGKNLSSNCFASCSR